MDLKSKTARLLQQLAEADSAERDQQRFLRAVRKFLEMDTLTAPLLLELVEKIIIHETEGTEKKPHPANRDLLPLRRLPEYSRGTSKPYYQEHICQGVEQAFYTA